MHADVSMDWAALKRLTCACIGTPSEGHIS
jgi:hypothetical protein